MIQVNRKSPIYKAVLWILLFASFALLWWLNTKVLTNPMYIKVDDFSHYWSAGRIILTRNNPYDPQRIQELKNQIIGQDSESDEKVAIVYTPPWSLPIVMPFGMLDYPLSRILWLLTSVTILLVCSTAIWRFYAGPDKYSWLAWVIGFSFAPTISVFEKGQITPIVLIGIIGFLYFIEKRSNDWIAGVFVALISVKPQLFFLFWLALAIWILMNKRWKLAISAVLSISIATILPVLFNPKILGQYLGAYFLETPTDWASPTLGGYLRLLFGIDKVWLQFLPILIGSFWFFFYFFRHQKLWVWSEQVPLLILVSFVFGGYAWTYDQVLSLVAIIPAFIMIFGKPWRVKSTFVVGFYILINLLDLFLHRELDEFWFVWLAPVILFWYLAVRNRFSGEDSAERISNFGHNRAI